MQLLDEAGNPCNPASSSSRIDVVPVDGDGSAMEAPVVSNCLLLGSTMFDAEDGVTQVSMRVLPARLDQPCSAQLAVSFEGMMAPCNLVHVTVAAAPPSLFVPALPPLRCALTEVAAGQGLPALELHLDFALAA